MRKVIVLLVAILFLFSNIVATETVAANAFNQDSWVSKAPMLTSRSRLGAAVVNGEIYAIGGDQTSLYGNCIGPSIGDVVNTCEKYNPTSDTWVRSPSMPTARCSLAVATYNNKIYCIGGFLANRSVTGTNEVYDSITNTWQTKASMPTPRMDLQANLVNGKIYLIGGSTEYASYLPLNEVYDPATDTWSVKTPCPYTISSGASATINGKIYFLAIATKLDLGAFIEIYDPAEDQWSTGAQVPTYGGIAAAASAVSGTKKADSEIVFLDESSSYIYYPENDTWAIGTPNPANVGFPAVTAFSGKLHVIGGIKAPFEGYIVTTSSIATQEEYTPNDARALASDTKIYIKQDGSIEPSTANITSADKLTYSFMSDISQRIVIQKDNTIINGNGYTLLGQSGLSYGIAVFQRNNIAVTNLTITQFDVAGIGIDKSTNIFILGNIISNNLNNGMRLYGSSNNTIVGNTIIGNQYMSGIQLMDGSNNNTIAANNIQSNQSGFFSSGSSGNQIYHNNFLQEHSKWINHVEASLLDNLSNTWDNGFPSGGNYWADYNGISPYVINQNNQDNYPLITQFNTSSVPLQLPAWKPPTASQEPSAQTNQTQSLHILLPATIAIVFVVCLVLFSLFRRLKHRR